MHLYVLGIFLCAYAKCTGGMICNSPWQEFQNMKTCYLRFNSQLPWKSAMLTCRDTGAGRSLVVIDNDKLNTFIHHNITNGSDVWLGLTHANIYNIYEWTWSDGHSVTYINDWIAASVNSFCVIMQLTEKTPYWYTQLCTYMLGFVCERDMVNHTCGNMWLEYDTHCYLILSKMGSKMNNMAAARYCWDQQAYLVSINNQSEAEFLYTNIQPGIEYWIGLSPLEWLDGTPLQWNNWDDVGPNKDTSCVYMNNSTGKWSSGSCDGRRRFVCQEELLDDIVSTTASTYSTTEISHSSTDLIHESTSIIFSNISKENTGISLTHNINVYIAVIVVLVVIVIGFIIAVTILVIYYKRRLLAKEPNLEGSAVYYNEVSDRSNAKQKHNDNRPNENSDIGNGPAVNDRSMYEQLSPESYQQSAKITTGDYASLK